jgi:hypothetical protein
MAALVLVCIAAGSLTTTAGIFLGSTMRNSRNSVTGWILRTAAVAIRRVARSALTTLRRTLVDSRFLVGTSSAMVMS